MLADVETLGVRGAADRHGLSEKTVSRWRARYGTAKPASGEPTADSPPGIVSVDVSGDLSDDGSGLVEGHDPLSGGPRPPSVDQVARVLVDADTLGDRYAARRHDVCERTIGRWRARYGELPEVIERVAALQARINDGFLVRARAARLRLLENMLEAAEDPKAPLRDRTDAFRRVNEATMAHEVLNTPDAANDNDDGDAPDDGAEPDDADQQGPAGPAQGESRPKGQRR